MARKGTSKRAETYRHAEEALLRPEVGTQAQFTRRKPPKTYRYDSSFSPALDWDGQNWARELGEWLLAQIEEASRLDPPFLFPEPRRFGDVEVRGLHDAVARLKALSRPFLNWAGKAERLSFDVPTLPLFVHERLSTKAILETLTGHERDRRMELTLFGDPQLPLHQQLEAYEHTGGWVNRLILGDSLVVMNSLLEYEGLGGQVQMIYIDPPYGVKFGSNFQPFVRRRDVKDSDDEHLTREPEMVKAYRDTWELGLHSYLTYLRDRLLLARELLTPSGSVFVQIGDENLHTVRQVIDEVFGAENFMSVISFRTKIPLNALHLPNTADYLIWYAKSKGDVRFRRLFAERRLGRGSQFTWIRLPDGSDRRMTDEELDEPALITSGSRPFRLTDLLASGYTESCHFEFEFDGERYYPPGTNSWKTTRKGIERLKAANRIKVEGKTPSYVFFFDDYPVVELTNQWIDTQGASGKRYAVQTANKVVERCMLMTTDPGDLVVDPTCGSGTTAYVAEQWGRRWITIDTSRVPLALTRQRLLTATFPYYELKDPERGPAGGFVYKRKQNAKGEEVGGIVPHVTLGSIANDEPPKEEVLVDRPEVVSSVTRVTGPFCVEATIPTPADLDGDGTDDATGEPLSAVDGSFVERMLEALRRSPVLQLAGNRTITLRNVRPPAKALTIGAEALLEPGEEPVAIVFGPENGAISEKLVYESAREAHARFYEQVLYIGFAIEPNARLLVEKLDGLVGIPGTYVQATPDLVMGDLLKTTRASQLFSVAGLPDVALRKLPPEEPGGPERFQVELRGLDVFDPTTMQAEHRAGDDVPAWLLDTDWNGLCFHVSQAFFPRTGAWDGLKRALKADFDESVWEHLSGTVSAPFLAGESGEIAVKVIDDRGNELMVVKRLAEAT